MPNASGHQYFRDAGNNLLSPVDRFKDQSALAVYCKRLDLLYDIYEAPNYNNGTMAQVIKSEVLSPFRKDR